MKPFTKALTFILATVIICMVLMYCKKESDDDTLPGIISESLDITPDGGTYTLDNGITVTVPEGAVTSNTTLTVSQLLNHHIMPIFSDYEGMTFNALTGFEISSSTDQFELPVSFTFRSLNAGSGFIPLTHTANRSDSTHSIDTCITTYNPDSDSLSVSVTNCGTYIVEKNYLLYDALNASSTKSGAANCREGLIIVSSGDKDVQCSFQDCQILESKVRVQFLSCPGQPVESAILRETGSTCNPVIFLTPRESEISTGSSTIVNAKVQLGCMEIKEAEVSFSSTSNGSVDPVTENTNSEGMAHTTFTAGDEEGTATVTAESYVRFPKQEVIINGEVIEALYITILATKPTDIKIRKADYKITLEMTYSSANYETVYYIMSFSEYKATVEFEVQKPISTSTNYYLLSGITGLGTQTMTGLQADLGEGESGSTGGIEYYYEPVSATISSQNIPENFPYELSVTHYDPATATGEFAVFAPGIASGSQNSFASWNLEYSYNFVIPSASMSENHNANHEESIICFYELKNGGNWPFEFELKDGFEDSGAGYMALSHLNGTCAYTLKVSKTGNAE